MMITLPKNTTHGLTLLEAHNNSNNNHLAPASQMTEFYEDAHEELDRYINNIEDESEEQLLADEQIILEFVEGLADEF